MQADIFQYMNPVQASEYLLSKGVQRTVGTLAKLRVTGGGPIYKKFGRAIIYDRHDLEEWIVAVMTPKAASTTQMRSAANGE